VIEPAVGGFPDDARGRPGTEPPWPPERRPSPYAPDDANVGAFPAPAGGAQPDDPWPGASMPPRRATGRPEPRAGGDAVRRGSAGFAEDAAGQDADSGDSGDSDPRTRGRGRKKKRSGPVAAAVGAVVEVVVVLAMALGLSFLIKTLLVQAFFIPSESMEDTLLVGDRVLVSKLTPSVLDLHRGDVIVFKDPDGWLTPAAVQPDESGFRRGLRDGLTLVGLLPADSGEHLIKRVIGMPGDHVVCCDANGRITVNGVGIDEPYVRDHAAPSDRTFDIVVEPGRLWVMGDNRPASADSRAHLTQPDHGQVPIDDVTGRAFSIVWPFDRFGWVHGAGETFAKVPAAKGSSGS